MKFNGIWSNSTDKIAIFRTVEDIIIHYRRVDDNHKPISGIHKRLAEDVLPSYTKEGSGRSYIDYIEEASS